MIHTIGDSHVNVFPNPNLSDKSVYILEHSYIQELIKNKL